MPNTVKINIYVSKKNVFLDMISEISAWIIQASHQAATEDRRGILAGIVRTTGIGKCIIIDHFYHFSI